MPNAPAPKPERAFCSNCGFPVRGSRCEACGTAQDGASQRDSVDDIPTKQSQIRPYAPDLDVDLSGLERAIEAHRNKELIRFVEQMIAAEAAGSAHNASHADGAAWVATIRGGVVCVMLRVGADELILEAPVCRLPVRQRLPALRLALELCGRDAASSRACLRGDLLLLRWNAKASLVTPGVLRHYLREIGHLSARYAGLFVIGLDAVPALAEDQRASGGFEILSRGKKIQLVAGSNIRRSIPPPMAPVVPAPVVPAPVVPAAPRPQPARPPREEPSDPPEAIPAILSPMFSSAANIPVMTGPRAAPYPGPAEPAPLMTGPRAGSYPGPAEPGPRAGSYPGVAPQDPTLSGTGPRMPLVEPTGRAAEPPPIAREPEPMLKAREPREPLPAVPPPPPVPSLDDRRGRTNTGGSTSGAEQARQQIDRRNAPTRSEYDGGKMRPVVPELDSSISPPKRDLDAESRRPDTAPGGAVPAIPPSDRLCMLLRHAQSLASLTLEERPASMMWLVRSAVFRAVYDFRDSVPDAVSHLYRCTGMSGGGNTRTSAQMTATEPALMVMERVIVARGQMPKEKPMVLEPMVSAAQAKEHVARYLTEIDKGPQDAGVRHFLALGALTELLVRTKLPPQTDQRLRDIVAHAQREGAKPAAIDLMMTALQRINA